jgi:phosphoribosylpyrophosphate synthetase
MRRRGNISLKLIAEMCVKAGFTHIITIDLHSKVIVVLFSVSDPERIYPAVCFFFKPLAPDPH